MSTQMKAQIDQLLTPVSSAYDAVGGVAKGLFPVVKHAQYSGKLGKYGSDHLRVEINTKGGKGKYRRVEATTRSTQTFQIEGHGLEGLVTKEDYANVAKPFDAEKDETLGITSMLAVDFERGMAAALTSTAIITLNDTLVGTEQFNDYDNSLPLDVFSTARGAVDSAVGAQPNVAVMDWLVFNKLRYHPQILDALGYKYARPGGLKAEELAVALDVEKVLIARMRYNSAKQGQAATLVPVWGKDILMAVIPASVEQRQVSLGYEIRLTDGAPMKTYKEASFNPPGSTKILVEDEYDILISNLFTHPAAYVIKDAIA